MEGFAEIANVPMRYEAHLIKGRLAADGIECFFYGDALAGVVGERAYPASSWSDPLGGIRVYVNMEDVAAASSILNKIEEQAPKRTTPRRGFPFVWQAVVAIAIALFAGTILEPTGSGLLLMSDCMLFCGGG